MKSNKEVQEIFTNNETSKVVGNLTDAINKAAAETFNIKPSKGQKQDCGPEIAVLIEQRSQAVPQHKEEETKIITKAIKNLAAQTRTNAQLDYFLLVIGRQLKEPERDSSQVTRNS